MIRRLLILMVCAAFNAALAGCAGDTNPIRDAFVATGIGTERKQAPDFVKGSRPATLDYAPVGIAQPKRTLAAKPKKGVAAAEAEMDAIRTRNDAKAKEAKEIGASIQPLLRPSIPPAPQE